MLRIRENVINIHEIAEDHYERYMQQEELYMNEQDNLYGSVSSDRVSLLEAFHLFQVTILFLIDIVFVCVIHQNSFLLLI